MTTHHMTLVTLQKGYDILGNRYLDNCIKNFSITWEDRIWSRFEIFKISHVRYKLIVIGILSISCVHFKLNLCCKSFLEKTHFWSLQSEVYLWTKQFYWREITTLYEHEDIFSTYQYLKEKGIFKLQIWRDFTWVNPKKKIEV